MLDTNVFDLFVSDEECYKAFDDLARKGRILPLSTHIQRDELSNAPDERAEALLELEARCLRVPTNGFIVGLSRVGAARIGGAGYGEYTRGNAKKHAKDALIGMTAGLEGATLVSGDVQLRKRAGEASDLVPCMSLDEFRSFLLHEAERTPIADE